MMKPWLRNYEKHVPVSLVYPDAPVHEFLLKTVAAHPDYVATTFNDSDITYGELNEKVNRLANALREMGIKKGDRVALLLVNSPVYVVAFFAVMKLGAVAVNLNVGIQGEELMDFLQDSDASVIITLDIFLHNAYRAAKNTAMRSIVLHSVFGLEKKIPHEEGVPACHMYTDLLAAQSGDEPVADVSSKDVAVLQYTSGSTGKPKAATLSHANIVASVFQTEAWVGIRDAGNVAVICMIPFFHVFGMSACLLMSVFKGHRMILMPRFDLFDILPLMKTIERYKPISFPAVPSLWAAILSYPDTAVREHLATIRIATSGGAPLPGWVHEKFEKLTGRKLMEAYGLSEASSATHFSPYPRGGPIDSIGLPLPDTEARIVDIESGLTECEVGEIGELVVKGPQIMQGYWNNPGLTAAALRNGWLYTGDLGKMDQDGFFYLVDRKDDLIISSGFNIYPSEIENVLNKHPKVIDSAVIGVPDRIKGQSISAVIVLKEGADGNQEEFMRFCRETLPEYRMPKRILFRNEIPRNPAGKPLRRVLRQDV